MLTFAGPLSASQVRTYHAEEFTSARENYFTRADHIRGRWHGHLARQWGLSGDVGAGHMERLADGCHPITDERLIRYTIPRTHLTARGRTVKTMAHRAGWDATFSAPKSISLTALVGSDERVRQAHCASAAVAIDHLERNIYANLGGARVENTRNWVAAAFEHDSARPVGGYAAPQLHTHVVFFNLTQATDGRIRPVQPWKLYKSAQYLTAVYRSELAARLIELGYEIERGAFGQPEIRGYTREYLEASSPRSRQIQEYLARVNLSGLGSAHIAAHRTREARVVVSRDEMQRRHREMANAFGDQPAHVVLAAQVRAPGIERRASAMTAHAAVTCAMERNLSREAVVDERAVLRDALRESMGEVTVGAIETDFERRVEAGEFIVMDRQYDHPARALTTREMADRERGRVLAHVDTERETAQRVNRRLAYAAVSRGL
jgi:conjugative relaxase-like TrwC/TraI family protein